MKSDEFPARELHYVHRLDIKTHRSAAVDVFNLRPVPIPGRSSIFEREKLFRQAGSLQDGLSAGSGRLKRKTSKVAAMKNAAICAAEAAAAKASDAI